MICNFSATWKVRHFEMGFVSTGKHNNRANCDTSMKFGTDIRYTHLIKIRYRPQLENRFFQTIWVKFQNILGHLKQGSDMVLRINILGHLKQGSDMVLRINILGHLKQGSDMVLRINILGHLKQGSDVVLRINFPDFPDFCIKICFSLTFFVRIPIFSPCVLKVQ